MKHKNKEGKRRKVNVIGVATLFTLTLSLTTLQAQTSVNATGGDASGDGGSASYSVGQVVYNANTGTNGSVTQGVQQPYEISEVTSIEDAEGIRLSVLAYPNPTADYLQLKVESEMLKDLSYQLYDMSGKMLQSEKISGSETQIDMSNLVTATYFLKVKAKMQGIASQEVKTFKIVKR